MVLPQPLHIVRLDGIHSEPPTFSPTFKYTYTEYPSTPFDTHTIVSRIKDADVVITTRIPITEETLQQCPRLKHVACLAIGTDMIDVPACTKRNILVTNVPAASVESVSEHALALFFALRRNVVGMHELTVETDEWVKKWSLKDEFGGFPGSCREEVVGILGGGELGTRLATLCRALGMTVYFANRKSSTPASPSTPSTKPSYLPFTQILQQSTLLFLTLPLTSSTTNLLSTPEFSLMRPDALLVNVARGGIVDENALVKALEEGRIGGAATDVFFEEPAGVENSVLVRKAREWKEGSLRGDGEGRKLSGRLVLSPHVAWWARSSTEKLRRTVAGNIEGWARGEVRNVVV
ncbi:hypothetical protein L207DRAFT_510472 [Hyaloscypha variabilis F]|uniref:Glycerate dehydrogenase n=1 Tax=Hyaloscypha variabilis (strain UAMH 11265 / GT02V1 / F) TaxID=1149755 RepID=A0A2J6RUN4_HYAVF|nr:hypothetical protein L207DRAFT_510472 [Hyaloscypha variabilis F]